MNRSDLDTEKLPGYAEWDARCKAAEKLIADGAKEPAYMVDAPRPEVRTKKLKEWLERSRLSTAATNQSHPFLVWRTRALKKFHDWATGKDDSNTISLAHKTPIREIMLHNVEHDRISHVYEARDPAFYYTKDDIPSIMNENFDMSFQKIPRSKQEGLDFAALLAANESAACLNPKGADFLIDTGVIQRNLHPIDEIENSLSAFIEMSHARAVATNAYGIYNSIIFPIVNGKANSTTELAAQEVLRQANFVHTFFDRRWLFFGRKLSLHKHVMPRDYLPWEVCLPALTQTMPDKIEHEYVTVSISEEFLDNTALHETLGLSVISILMSSLLCAIPLTELELRYLIQACHSLCAPPASTE